MVFKPVFSTVPSGTVRGSTPSWIPIRIFWGPLLIVPLIAIPPFAINVTGKIKTLLVILGFILTELLMAIGPEIPSDALFWFATF